MMAIYLQPQIDRTDYRAFKRLMPNDVNLPETYHDWLKDQAKELRKISKAGNVVKEIPVEPDEFVHYCRANAINTDSSALGSFTAAKTIKEKLLAPSASAVRKGFAETR